MMSRDVKIIRTDRCYWIISIDDKIVQLSRYRYRIDLGVVENVENTFNSTFFVILSSTPA